MNTDPELFDRFRRCPVGIWSTGELAPSGCRLQILLDGRGVLVEYSGLARQPLHFEWRLDPGGAFEVRQAGGGDETETDSEYLDWHPSPFLLSSATTLYTKRIVPAIVFSDGLLSRELSWLSLPSVNESLLFDGDPSPTPDDTK